MLGHTRQRRLPITYKGRSCRCSKDPLLNSWAYISPPSKIGPIEGVKMFNKYVKKIQKYEKGQNYYYFSYFWTNLGPIGIFPISG